MLADRPFLRIGAYVPLGSARGGAAGQRGFSLLAILAATAVLLSALVLAVQASRPPPRLSDAGASAAALSVMQQAQNLVDAHARLSRLLGNGAAIQIAAGGSGSLLLPGSGGLSPQTMDAEFFDPAATSRFGRYWVFKGAHALLRGVGQSDAPDVVFVLPGLRDEVCRIINRDLGVSADAAAEASLPMSDALSQLSVAAAPVERDDFVDWDGRSAFTALGSFMPLQACLKFKDGNLFYTVAESR